MISTRGRAFYCSSCWKLIFSLSSNFIRSCSWHFGFHTKIIKFCAQSVFISDTWTTSYRNLLTMSISLTFWVFSSTSTTITCSSHYPTTSNFKSNFILSTITLFKFQFKWITKIRCVTLNISTIIFINKSFFK